MTSTPLFDKQDKFVLKDGRSIGYLIAGDEKSKTTVVHCVMNAACRFMAQTMSDKADGVRLIGIDRPGIGLSDHQESPDLLAHARDVIELMDHLKVGRFSVVGEQMGGAHALAIAHEAQKLNKNVVAVGLLSTVGPPETYESKDMSSDLRFGIFLTKRMPAVGNFLMKSMFSSKWKKAREDTDYLIEFEKLVIKNDYKDKADVDFASTIDRDTWISMGAGNVESFRQGPSGTCKHIALWTKPWGFDLKDITVPVYLYQGEEDTFLPRSMIEKMAEELPKSTVHYEKNAASLSTSFKCMEQALKDVTSSGNTKLLASLKGATSSAKDK